MNGKSGEAPVLPVDHIIYGIAMDVSFSSPIKSDLTEQILADIIKLIEKRQYEPGESLQSERELAERINTGRGVIRAALTILENLRYREKRQKSHKEERRGGKE